MFKVGNFEKELLESMAKTLEVEEYSDKISKISRAADHLNSAAELLDSAGLMAHADEIVDVLQALAAPTLDTYKKKWGIEMEDFVLLAKGLLPFEKVKLIVKALLSEDVDVETISKMTQLSPETITNMAESHTSEDVELTSLVNEKTPEELSFTSLASKKKV